MKPTIDPLELQRLLDDRLSRSERAAFLDGLDDDPCLWRTVALAFVEEQLMRNAFRGPAAVAVSPPVNSLSRNKRPRGTWLLTSIALTAFALTIGVLLGRSNLMSAKGQNLPANSDSSQLAVQPDGDKTAGDYYVVVTPPAEAAPAAKPINTVVDPFDTLTTPIFDKRSRDLAKKYGYRLSEEPVLYMFHDGNGGQYVIPQRRVSFIEEKK